MLTRFHLSDMVLNRNAILNRPRPSPNQTPRSAQTWEYGAVKTRVKRPEGMHRYNGSTQMYGEMSFRARNNVRSYVPSGQPL